jgi:hypothetical protein
MRRVTNMHRTLTVLAGASLAAMLFVGSAPPTSMGAGGSSSSSVSSAYPWPIRPFYRSHPVRAVFGDPRTSFLHSVNGDPLAGSGKFSFHDGIDIDAPNGTRVYPVLSGTARLYKEGVEVVAVDGRRFIYRHIVPLIHSGQAVTAQRTVLGRVDNWAQELHFTEMSAGGRTTNPLLTGHLKPYQDTTQPTVAAVVTRDESGYTLEPFDVHGRITLIANACDLPMPLLPRAIRGFPVSAFARDRFSVVPAALTWSLFRLNGGRTVVPETTVVDFRRGLPPEASFWRIYARGTFQNRAPVVPRYHKQMPGRYLFTLTPSTFDTRRLHDGVYVLTVTAIDVRGNKATLVERIEIRNRLSPARS